jgi:hypothetical protein
VPACSIKIAWLVPDTRAGFGAARPNRACDDGIKGALTETQTDASRRTILGARNGLQWAAHLDLLQILLLDRLDQLQFSLVHWWVSGFFFKN